jgi:MFS superfamily sulfate permease-like transporter
MVMYALFGTSRQLIMGPKVTTAITATAIAPLAGGVDRFSDLLSAEGRAKG